MSQTNLKDESLIQEILVAAAGLFSQYGLRKTTMDDVAKAVGKGKSSLYYYYPGKAELFEAVVRAELENLIKDIRVAINGETSSRAKLKAFLLSRLKLKQKLFNLKQVVYDDLFDNYQEICRIKEEFELTQIELIREIVLGGIQTGEFRKMNTQDIQFFSQWAMAAFGGLELPLSANHILIANENSCNKVVDFILFGIGR